MNILTFAKRFWWAGLILFILIFIAATSYQSGKWKIGGNPKNDSVQNTNLTRVETAKPELSMLSLDSDEGWPSKDAKYITAVPVDLTQIQSISKYRSCAGHDNSGYSFERNLETDRSMKHYIFPSPAFQGTINKVKMFAPFDGAISKIVFEKDEIGKPGKRPNTGNGISLSTPVDKYVLFEFGHIYFVKDYKVGDSVKAGELIGYAALGEKLNDFDIGLGGALWTEEKQPILGSAFDHMTDFALAEFAKYGITPDNTKITKEYRDTHPCNYASQQQTGSGPEHWAQLKH